jgi:hypothetical protein
MGKRKQQHNQPIVQKASPITAGSVHDGSAHVAKKQKKDQSNNKPVNSSASVVELDKGNNTLEWMVSPVTTESFFSKHFEKEPLHVRAAKRGKDTPRFAPEEALAGVVRNTTVFLSRISRSMISHSLDTKCIHIAGAIV